jgi:FtsH-binding integral membrane protein
MLKFSRLVSKAAKTSNPFFSNKSQLAKPLKLNQRRQASTWSTSGGESSKVLAVAGLVGLVGGGFFLLNTLNQPIMATTSYSSGVSSREVVVQKEAKPTISPYVQNYLFNTYKFVAAGLGLTTLSAYMAYRSGFALRLMEMNPLVSGIGFTVAIIGSAMLTRSISVENTFAKTAAFTTFNVVMGLSLCGLAFMHPSILLRAGIYTGGIVGALSFTAMNAREDRFLALGAPLMAGLAVVFLSGLTAMFLPARFAKTLSVMENIWLYGGLLVFGGMMLYDTQKLMAKAKVREDVEGYGNNRSLIGRPDFINESIGIYLNIINLFIRMVMILQNGQNKRK